MEVEVSEKMRSYLIDRKRNFTSYCLQAVYSDRQVRQVLTMTGMQEAKLKLESEADKEKYKIVLFKISTPLNDGIKDKMAQKQKHLYF